MSPELHFVTPEAKPLELFEHPCRRPARPGRDPAAYGDGVRGGHAQRRARRHAAACSRVRRSRACRPTSDGFLVTDPHGRVAPGVFAAGDVTNYEIKQGGLACQMADAAAEHIAADAGAPVAPAALQTRAPGPAADRPLGALPAPGGGGRRSPPAACAGRRRRSPAASSRATSRRSSLTSTETARPFPVCHPPSIGTPRRPRRRRGTSTAVNGQAVRRRNAPVGVS